MYNELRLVVKGCSYAFIIKKRKRKRKKGHYNAIATIYNMKKKTNKEAIGSSRQLTIKKQNSRKKKMEMKRSQSHQFSFYPISLIVYDLFKIQ